MSQDLLNGGRCAGGHDPDRKVRRDAAWGLGVSQSKRAEKPLLRVIADDTDEDARQTAKRSLTWIRHNGLERTP